MVGFGLRLPYDKVNPSRMWNQPLLSGRLQRYRHVLVSLGGRIDLPLHARQQRSPATSDEKRTRKRT